MYPHTFLRLPLHLYFTAATTDGVRRTISGSSNSSCALDIIPAFLLKSCIDALIEPITTLINLSLSEGVFPSDFNSALVPPLHKKHSLPKDDLSSYRPISNLNFISKLLERIIQTRITSHLQLFPSLTPFQSAYCPFHSTETALLRIHHDLVLSCNQQKVSALVMLDLSAAFDTIDHNILLTRLSSTYGVTSSALSLLSSYLLNRSQSVTINQTTSSSSTITTGVPQGLVLGPLLFSLYTSPISQIFVNSLISFHLYADDTRLYISFSASDADSTLSQLSATLDVTYTWLTANRLCVKPSKTEYILFGTYQQRRKITSSTLSFCGNILSPSAEVKHLGVTLTLTFPSKPTFLLSAALLSITFVKSVRHDHLLTQNQPFCLPTPWSPSNLIFATPFIPPSLTVLFIASNEYRILWFVQLSPQLNALNTFLLPFVLYIDFQYNN